MTKERFIGKYDLTATIISDLEAVIAYEIEQTKGEDKTAPIKETKKVCENCKVEISNWGCGCGKKDKPAPNPIAEAYERGGKIRYKRLWQKNEWIKKYNDRNGIDENGRIMKTQEWTFWDNIKDWEIYTEPEAEQVTDQVKPKFDQERFERMFRAVVASGRTDNEFIETDEILKQLDAYYASQKGGNNE